MRHTLLLFVLLSSLAAHAQDRTDIEQRLSEKIKAGQALVVHVFVPLCDNEHQGIVPTTASLGNGLSLRSNLYWATSKGMKRYFKEQSDWLLLVEQKDPSSNILERVVFKKSYKNGATVYLVADAWRGDRMPQCLTAYFKAVAASSGEVLQVDNQTLSIGGGADMLAFNGHNGMMDESVAIPTDQANGRKDAVSISCVSTAYFPDALQKAGGYPLVMTTGLLFPGATVLEYIVDSWAKLEPSAAIAARAGDAYHDMKPKVSTSAARRLFNTGW